MITKAARGWSASEPRWRNGWRLDSLLGALVSLSLLLSFTETGREGRTVRNYRVKRKTSWGGGGKGRGGNVSPSAPLQTYLTFDGSDFFRLLLLPSPCYWGLSSLRPKAVACPHCRCFGGRWPVFRHHVAGSDDRPCRFVGLSRESVPSGEGLLR